MCVDFKIRTAISNDSSRIAEIYNPYVLRTSVSFEEKSVSSQEIERRMSEVRDSRLPYLVAENKGLDVIGYAYASKWKGRCAYRFSAETSIYLADSAIGQGVGNQLYHTLLAQLEIAQVHLALAGIALPNDASVRFHEKMGFKKVAHFQEVGFKFGRWIDVGYWQLIL